MNLLTSQSLYAIKSEGKTKYETCLSSPKSIKNNHVKS